MTAMMYRYVPACMPPTCTAPMCRPTHPTPQTHEEVLRLLLAAARPGDGGSPLLTANEVGTYLKETLDNSKHSRKRCGDGRGGGGSFAGGGFWVGVWARACVHSLYPC